MRQLRSHEFRRHHATCAIGALCAVAVSCDSASQQAPTKKQSSSVSAAPTTPTIAVERLLSLRSRITDSYVHAHGSCVPTAPRPERSRLVYLMLPEDTGYVRINVVTSANGATVEMIDLVRGLPLGGQWSATQAHATADVVTRAFATISDHAPLLGSLSATGAEARQLRDVATATLGLPCPTSD
jgi:hypothetical protein